MYATAGYTHRYETVAHLAHDNPPVSPSSDCSADGVEFSFPVWSDLVWGQVRVVWTDIEQVAPVVTTSGLSAPKLF